MLALAKRIGLDDGRSGAVAPTPPPFLSPPREPVVEDFGAANDPRIRGHAHDPEWAGQAGERFECSATDSVHRQAVRGGCMKRRRVDPTSRSLADL